MIRASKKLNDRFSREIDAKVADDPIVKFGRRDANARGHSGASPVPRWSDARPWTSGALDPSEERFNIDFPPSGNPKIYDKRKGKFLSNNILNQGVLVVPNLMIDSEARYKFCVKTLLGVGWKVFGPGLLSSINTDSLRAALGVGAISTIQPFKLWYLDPFVAAPTERPYVQMIERNLVHAGLTTILARENDGELEWSVACVGHYVGSIVLPTRARLLPADVTGEGGLLMLAMRGSLRREVQAHVA